MSRVVLPELGQGIETATVACWHARVGEAVRPDDDIVELVTDKATFSVPAGGEGILREILIPEGQEAGIGATLAIIEGVR